MSDYISREELLKAIDTWDKFGCDGDSKIVPYNDNYVPYIHYDDVIKCIKGMPSVTQEPKTEPCEDCISRHAVIERIKREEMILYTPTGMNYLIRTINKLPSVTPQEQKTGHCIWCSSPYRIEYYWIDRNGYTASFQDEDRHIIATGIAKYCPNCGAKMESEE